MSVRVRFAPSNTGYLHMGGARTALFNYLFARHRDGDFLLRIEDTDRERSEEKYTEAIFEAHDWLGLTPDEEPVFQSDRTELYRQKAEELLESGHAYRDYSTEEEIERARQEAYAGGDRTAHTRLWRDRDDAPADRDSVVRIASPLEGQMTIRDAVQGEVTVDAEELDDFVLLRSDGTPTYNFCVVVDDAAMDITHVVRGKDHLDNAFRQTVVYRALDLEPPGFAHLPLIEGLSKRKGSTSVQEYREMGYLAEAVVNYLARLGWSHGDRELFEPDELVDLFSLEDVGRSSSEFDIDKLTWVNEQWLQRLDGDRLADAWRPFLREAGLEPADDDRLASVAEEMAPRAETLVDLTEQSNYFFSDSLDRNADDVDEWLTPDIEAMFEELIDVLSGLDDWSVDAIDDGVRGVCDTFETGLGSLAQPVRVATTGGTSSPGLFTTLRLLGRETSVARLEEGLALIRQSDEPA